MATPRWKMLVATTSGTSSGPDRAAPGCPPARWPVPGRRWSCRARSRSRSRAWPSAPARPRASGRRQRPAGWPRSGDPPSDGTRDLSFAGSGVGAWCGRRPFLFAAKWFWRGSWRKITPWPTEPKKRGVHNSDPRRRERFSGNAKSVRRSAASLHDARRQRSRSTDWRQPVGHARDDGDRLRDSDGWKNCVY